MLVASVAWLWIRCMSNWKHLLFLLEYRWGFAVGSGFNGPRTRRRAKLATLDKRRIDSAEENEEPQGLEMRFEQRETSGATGVVLASRLMARSDVRKLSLYTCGTGISVTFSGAVGLTGGICMIATGCFQGSFGRLSVGHIQSGARLAVCRWQL